MFFFFVKLFLTLSTFHTHIMYTWTLVFQNLKEVMKWNFIFLGYCIWECLGLKPKCQNTNRIDEINIKYLLIQVPTHIYKELIKIWIGPWQLWDASGKCEWLSTRDWNPPWQESKDDCHSSETWANHSHNDSRSKRGQWETSHGWGEQKYNELNGLSANYSAGIQFYCCIFPFFCQVRLENIRKERDILKQVENRLAQEKESVLTEQRGQNLLLTNLKSIQVQFVAYPNQLCQSTRTFWPFSY